MDSRGESPPRPPFAAAVPLVEEDQEIRLIEQISVATSTVRMAVAELKSDDPYGILLCQWLDKLEKLGNEDRPDVPPKLDKRKLGAELCQLRSDARAAALDLRKLLHDNWHAIRHELDVREKAEYDSQRDWTRAARAEAAAFSRIKQLTSEWKREDAAKQAAREQARKARCAADERLFERHASVRAPRAKRDETSRVRQRQWLSRRHPPPNSSDSDSEPEDPEEYPQLSREQRATHRHQRRYERRRMEPRPPPPTDAEVVQQAVEGLIASLEREARKASVIADGATLYDADFYRIDPRKRKPDDDGGAFVAYPDGSRCWVHPPFSTSYDPNGGNAPISLFGVKDPRLLVMPWALDRGFRAPESIDGVTADEVGQVCVLLLSRSLLLTLRGNSRRSSLYAPLVESWIATNLQSSRCSEHDWCYTIRVPCATDSPERVLVAVLGHHETWSVSSLADAWRQTTHAAGICAFTRGSQTTASIRPLPPTAPRSLRELVIPIKLPGNPCHRPIGWAAAFDAQRKQTACRCSRREVQPGVIIECGPHRLPPEKRIHVRVGQPLSGFGCVPTEQPSRGCFVFVQSTSNTRDSMFTWHWREQYVCVCDATLPELRLVQEARDRYEQLSEEAHERKMVKIRADHERGMKAAATRRENTLKRKLEETGEDEIDSEMEEYAGAAAGKRNRYGVDD